MRLHPLVPVIATAFALTACDDGTGPDRPARVIQETGVTAALDADVVTTDSSVVVNGQVRFAFPNLDAALRFERYNRFDWGGTTLSSDVRHADVSWILMLHQSAEFERNDSTIWSYVDHGDAAIEGVVLDKDTQEPGVMPGDPLGFEGFVLYRQPISTRILWLAGNETDEVGVPYLDALEAGGELAVSTSGSAAAPPATGSFELASIARLVAIENGAALELDAVTAPILDTAEPLVLEFDEPLDPERAWIFVYPSDPAPANARRAYLQPETAAERVIIPASLLAALVHELDGEPVAYRVVVHEYWTEDGALTGTLDGEPYSLPLFQISSTSLDVWIQP